MSESQKMLIVAAAGVAAFMIWMINKGASNTGAAIGSAAVDMANGVVTGAVVGAGQIVGVPATNQTQCQQDMAAGKTWEASFSCPAGDFLKYAIFG